MTNVFLGPSKKKIDNVNILRDSTERLITASSDNIKTKISKKKNKIIQLTIQ